MIPNTSGDSARFPVGRVYSTTCELFDDAAERASERECWVYGDVRIAYGEASRYTAAFAGWLASSFGNRKRVAVLLPNCLELPIVTIGIHKTAGQVTLLNPNYTARELNDLLDDLAPDLLVTDRLRSEALGRHLEQHVVNECIIVGDGGLDLTGLPASDGPELEAPKGEDIAFVQYTGGTTGRSKGVIMTQAGVMLMVAKLQAMLPARPDIERFLCSTPLFHGFALFGTFFSGLYSRGAVVILPRYRPLELLKTIERERITVLPILPTVFSGLLATPEFATADLSSLHSCHSGAAPLPLEFLQRWEARTGVPVCEGYGLTEAGGIITYNPQHGARKPGSVGLPLPDTDVQIVDVEIGTKVLPVGQLGEIRCRGAQMMVGYRNLPEETAEIIRDGWLYTGDIGELDEDGYLYIRDRKKEMAIVGGYNVFPREIEEVLHCHADVVEAGACGLPDAHKGETIRAYVRVRETAHVSERELLDFCATNLAPYKVPSSITLVDELPRTGAGKLDRKALRAGFTARATSR